MPDQELIQQLQTAMTLLGEINRELHWRLTQTPVVTHFPSLKRGRADGNDPSSFYLNCCTFKDKNEITASELFQVYKKWCNNNGYLTRGEKLFVDTIAELGAPDGIRGVMRKQRYTFRNLALKTR